MVNLSPSGDKANRISN